MGDGACSLVVAHILKHVTWDMYLGWFATIESIRAVHVLNLVPAVDQPSRVARSQQPTASLGAVPSIAYSGSAEPRFVRTTAKHHRGRGQGAARRLGTVGPARPCAAQPQNSRPASRTGGAARAQVISAWPGRPAGGGSMAKVSGLSLWLTDSHKADLEFMKQIEVQFVDEFARLAIEFLRQVGAPTSQQPRLWPPPRSARTRPGLAPTDAEAHIAWQGPNEKFFRQAAKKLSVPTETVEGGLNSLGFLMLEAARVGLVDEEMMVEALTINELGFDDAVKAAIAKHYAQNINDLAKINATQQLTTSHYKDLEWRLDVQVASRSARQQVLPTMLLKMHTHREGSQADAEDPVVMQADYANLRHLATELQAAIQESNSHHHRRLSRYIK
eukprot:SAG31_NODE_5771_length_2334_cov_4.524832_1_plen_387_part_00